ncbi:MAG: hypothetical protein JNL76_07965 [Alphaproteobacteria bacterium]|nr:hypothetical protein [Alphaproteobacteria bacterium]
MPHSTEDAHPILQLHGGGTLVLGQLIKCAIIELITGKRIPNLFPSIIADSGGAIVALGLHFKSAEEILDVFMRELPNVLPDRKFFLSQAVARKNRHFDPTGLKTALENVFGKKTLADVTGNIFIRTHAIDGDSQRISKISHASGPEYSHADGSTSLVDILLKATAIPGILPAPDGKYIDTLTDQNPLAVLIKLQKAFVQKTFRYVMVGNIHHTELPASFRDNSFIRNHLTGVYQSYAALHRQSAHIEDLQEFLGSSQITSLITLSKHRFSSIDNSARQRTNLTIETLDDIAARKEEYEKLARTLLGGTQNLAMTVEQAIARIRVWVDPYMVREKVISDTPDEIPAQFPSPSIVPTCDTAPYKIGHLAGCFLAKASPDLTRIIISHDFNWGAVRRSILVNLSGNFLPSRRPIKSAADPGARSDPNFR